MPTTPDTPWLHRFAVLTALATLGLIAIGGLVTSQGVGMAVPDWPTTYGYNMFLFPVSKWVGGVFYEHTHRLVATVVGVLVVALTRWLGGRGAGKPLIIIGLLELAAGFGLLSIAPKLSGAGYFLSGIGAVVLLAGIVWLQNEPATPALQKLGWLAFTLVQIQGLLGGLRVVLFNDQIGILHAALAQIFFVLLCAIALLTSRWWRNLPHLVAAGVPPAVEPGVPPGGIEQRPAVTLESSARGAGGRTPAAASWIFSGTLLVFCQLILGAAMRHQHAGLAIPDFPLAYHKLWPPMDANSVARYNQLRLDSRDFNPITAFQIGLQMAHRLAALGIFCVVAWCAWLTQRESAFHWGAHAPRVPWLAPRQPQMDLRAEPALDNRPRNIPTGEGAGQNTRGRVCSPSAAKSPAYLLSKFSLAWLGLILFQILLGAATIWFNKPADIATAHVVAGALSLVTGALLTIVSFRVLIPGRVGILPLPDSSQTPLGSGQPAVSAAK